jgi:methionyl-tRNA formyltransferase
VGSAFPDVTNLAIPPRHPRRIVFLGTPVDAVPTLKAIVDAGFEVPLVVSQPDRRRGRGGDLVPSPVKEAAVSLGLEVSSDLGSVLVAEADLCVVVAYGELIPTPMLEVVPMVNLHFSLLPRWRGAAPVERAMLAGDEITGVCIMQLAPRLDTGDLYAVAEHRIPPDITALDLRSELAVVGANLMVSTISAGLEGATPQIGEPSYAHKFVADDFRLEFERSAVDLHRVVRVGGAWTTFRGERFKVWQAQVQETGAGVPGAIDGVRVACGVGSLVLEVVQPMGKQRIDAEAWARGARLEPTDRMDS